MLDKPIEEIVYEGGKVVGVKSQGEVGCSCTNIIICRFSVHLHNYYSGTSNKGLFEKGHNRNTSLQKTHFKVPNVHSPISSMHF